MDEWRLRQGLSVTKSLARYACPNVGVASDAPRLAGACDSDDELSVVRGAAEAVERFAAGDVRRDQLHFLRAAEIEGRYLDPRKVVAYTSSQHTRGWLKSHAFLRDDMNVWVQGESLSGDIVYLLAETVYYPFPRLLRGRTSVYTDATSSGVAAHPDKATALKGAYSELVERDAFMRCWLSREVPSRLVLDSLPLPLRELCTWIEEQGYEVHLLALASAVKDVPVIVAVGHGAGGLLLGASTGGTSDSLRHAMEELLVAVRDDNVKVVSATEVRHPADHRLLYRDPRNHDKARFLWAGPATITFDDLGGSAVTALPNQAVVFDLTSEETLPLQVWRCFCPGLIPISFGVDREPLGLASAHVSPHSPHLARGELFPHPFA
ncbi:MAG: YcaO-like family protein [Actinomycetota bacterium]|nr:YcaO-like family protein [Actinomycetota bacterium]